VIVASDSIIQLFCFSLANRNRKLSSKSTDKYSTQIFSNDKITL